MLNTAYPLHIEKDTKYTAPQPWVLFIHKAFHFLSLHLNALGGKWKTRLFCLPIRSSIYNYSILSSQRCRICLPSSFEQLNAWYCPRPTATDNWHTDLLSISFEKYSSLLFAQVFNKNFLYNFILILSVHDCYYVWIWKPDRFFQNTLPV